MGEPPGPHETILLRRSYFVRNLGALIGLVGCALAFADVGHHRFLLVLAFGTVAAALVVLGAEGFLHRVPALLDDSGVRVGNRIVTKPDTIRSGWIERSPESSIVHLDRGLRPPVRLEARDELDAEALLVTLKRDPTHTLARFPSASRLAFLAALIWGQLFAHALLGRGPSHVVSLAVALLLVLPLLVGLRDVMCIGADGILFVGPLQRRFVAFGEVESAVTQDCAPPSSRKVVIVTRTHETFVRRMRTAAADAALERVQAAMGARGFSIDPVRVQLRRNGPDVRAWLARLRSFARPGPYRAVGASDDLLWRVIDDPGAAESERAGAALVLGAAATQDERSRLRRVAARTASPRVRVAIERVAEAAGEDELTAAMAAINDSTGW
jgi:hypothetical protein